MTPRDWFRLVLLAAIWGGSFLFMRVAVPAFGPVPLIALRVGIAAVVLGAVARVRNVPLAFRAHGPALLLVGVINSAVPFTLFAYATQTVTAGLAAVLNATVPLFGMLIAAAWLGQRVTARAALGLGLGLLGVATLVWTELTAPSHWLAVGAGLAASALYAIAAHYAKRRLHGVPPLVVSAGSQVGAALALAPFAFLSWPGTPIAASSWGAAIALGVVCTGVAYLLYFRLIADVGPDRAVLVTYFIPVFGVLWGAVVLAEQITVTMLLGAIIVLVGVAQVNAAGRPATAPSQDAIDHDR